MLNTQIRIRATSEEIQRLRQQVHEAGITTEQLVWSDRLPARRGLIDRQPLGQMELFDIVISVATGIASNAIYTQLRDLLKKAEDKGKVQVVEEKKPEKPTPTM